MGSPRLDGFTRGQGRTTTRRAAAGALLGAFVAGRAPEAPAAVRAGTAAPDGARRLPAAQIARYAITDLGTGSGNAGRAWLISADGAVAGDQARFADGVVDPASIRLILWRAGGEIDLTALGITGLQWFDDAGDLIARRGSEVVRYDARADRVEPAPNALPTVDPPTGFSRAVVTARNARGEIVGAVVAADGNASGVRGFVLTGQGMTVLDPVAGGDTSVAGDINNAGIVVGGPAEEQPGPLPGLGFRYDLVTGTTTDLLPLPDYLGTAASGVNALGEVVGAAHHAMRGAPSRLVACLWRAGASEPIALESLLPAESAWRCRAAYDINDAGSMVGSGWIGDEPNVRPFVLRPVP